MKNTFLENLYNLTYTENGALTFKSSLNKNLDLFFMGGAIRKSPNRIRKLFEEAYDENAEYALKNLFYFRDIRGGQGERNIFRIAIKDFYLYNPEWFSVENLKLIPEYGRWDDLILLVEIDELKDKVIKILKEQIDLDILSNNPSLLAKWMPSENASSFKTKNLAKILINSKVFGSAKNYRKMLTSLRLKINIVETSLTKKQYLSINYSMLPSKASLKYIKAFKRNDEINYLKFLEDVKSGKTKIQTKTLYPNEIVKRVLLKDVDENETLNILWNNLPDYVEDFNGLVVADVSGSMGGDPITVSIGLALYIAERNKSILWKDHFLTFSKNPTLEKIKEGNIVDKIDSLSKANWGMNTNLQKIFDIILDRVIESKDIKQEHLPKMLIIISDMEFDVACNNKTNVEKIQKRYKKYNLEMPKLVFWNVDSRNNNVPITKNEKGVFLMSGYSPILIKFLFNLDNPEDIMLNVINSNRYEKIKV